MKLAKTILTMLFVILLSAGVIAVDAAIDRLINPLTLDMVYSWLIASFIFGIFNYSYNDNLI